MNGSLQSITPTSHSPTQRHYYISCLWNTHSLVNKIRNFQSYVYSSSYSLVAVVETWLSPCILNNGLFPSGYNIFHKDRACRGGVLLAVYQSLLSYQLFIPLNLEVLTVQIKTHVLFLFCVVYIPPNSSSEYRIELLKCFESILTTPTLLYLEILIFMTSAGQNFQATHTKHSKDLSNFIFQDSHTQLVTFPTHISGNTLNLILFADYYLVQEVKHLSQHTSDHYRLSFTIPVTPPSSDSKCFFLYDFKRADFNSITFFSTGL